MKNRQVLANSVDPEQTDQGLRCLPFRLYDALLNSKTIATQAVQVLR